MDKELKEVKWRSLWMWLAIFLPLAIFTIDWVVIHGLLLFVIGPGMVGISLRKDGRHYWPITIAFCSSMLFALFSYEYFKQNGIADILPRLLGQLI